MKKFYLLILVLIAAGTLSAQDRFYLGVDNPNVTPACSNCHSDDIAQWEQTGHATAHTALDNDHYGYSCLECHNTGWDPNVVNGGADEFVTAGDNNSYTITDSTKWGYVANVQCESCHGPVGSAENTLDFGHTGDKTGYDAETCGQCHQEGHHPYMEEWSQSGHASGAPAFFSRNTHGECYYCHFAQDFVKFVEDSANYDPFEEVEGGDAEYLADITCVTCHDPHGSDNPGSLRLPVSGDEVICDVCHTSQVESVDVTKTPHHTTSEALSGSEYFGYQYPGESYQNSIHTFAAANRCIDCHVHSEGFNSETGTAVTGHTFEASVEACAECHTDYYSVVDTSNHETMFDYRGVQSRIDSLMGVLEAELAAATSADSQTFEFQAALYNYRSVDQEGSMGIHNTKLVEKLLNDAIESFMPTEVKQEDGLLPAEYNLSQNYPNPFNPSTTIKFSIPEAGNVNITVYDALGKEVAVLADGEFNAGSYKVTWNGADVSSGVYFYRINSENYNQVRKMLLIK